MKKKGRPYSEKEKRACLKKLREGMSFAQVSERCGVSVSTLRKWYKQESEPAQRENSQQALGQMAREGMRMNVDLLVRRLETACTAEREMEQIRGQLRRLGPKEKGESEDVTRERTRLETALESYYHLSDTTAATFLKTLMAVRAKEEMPRADGELQNYETLLKSVMGEEF